MKHLLRFYQKAKILLKNKLIYKNIDFSIYKSYDRIFEIGNIDLEHRQLKFINTGLKYVPTFNKIDLYFLIYNFYNSLHSLNNNVIFATHSTNTNNNSNIHPQLIKYLNKNFPNPKKDIFTLNNSKEFYKLYFTNLLKEFNTDQYNNTTSFSFFDKLLRSIKNKNIIITQCDKNVGISLFQSSIYNSLCINHLKDSNTYKPLTHNPQQDLLNSARLLLSDLKSKSHISSNLASILTESVKNKKLPKFRALPKLHKPNFDIRPLINCSNTTTSCFSKTIDFYLKPIMTNHFTYLKDSQYLLQKIHNLTLEPDSELLTADFSSLYTNIPLDDCITVISDIIKLHNLDHINASGFHSLLKFTLINSFFSFTYNKSILYFQQIKGVPMGTACGPTVACVYLSYFELRYHHMLNKTIFFRFIDDIFQIIKKGIFLPFKDIYPNLTLNIETGNSVTFLDLSISINNDLSLDTNLYVKPTHTSSLLPYNSNHPSHITKNIPKSLICRIKKICSDHSNFLINSSKTHLDLITRGFPHNTIQHHIRYYSSLDRISLLPYKSKPMPLTKNTISFTTFFDKNLPNLYNKIKDYYDLSFHNYEFSLKIYYKIYPNLNTLLINNINPYSYNHFSICKKLTCKTCPHANTNNILTNIYNLPILIPSKSSCSSTNCIYIIQCTRHNIFYIGQTSRMINIRIVEHLRKIRKYKKSRSNNDFYLTDSDKDQTYLYNHFSDPNHNLDLDFKFQVFVSNFSFHRLRMETDLIYLFNTQYPKGLNTCTNQNLQQLTTYPTPPIKSTFV